MTKVEHIAIISNGPSAELFDRVDRDTFDTVVGVNWTVSRWVCDWWCFCDWGTFIKTVPLGTPRMFISKHVVEKLPLHSAKHAARLQQWDEQIVVQQDVELPPLAEDIGKWNAFSGCAALGLAWHLGAGRVTVFGADMSGQLDHAGKSGPSRTPQRWKHERNIWNALTTALENAGVHIHKVQ